MTDLENASVEELEKALAVKKAKESVTHNLEHEPLPKMKEKRIFKIQCSDFQQWIKNVFGVTKYEIVAIEEWSNDASHEFNVRKKEPIIDSSYDEFKDIESFLYRGCPCPMWSTSTLLQYLCNKDILPEGDYMIGVYW